MRSTLVPLFFGFLLLTGCLHTAALDAVPSAMQDRLARHPLWLTIASLDHPGIKFPPAEMGAVKRWQVVLGDDEAIELQETAMSSFIGYIRRAFDNDVEPSSIDLRDTIEMREFFPYDDWGSDIWHKRKVVTRFRPLDDKRFVLELVAPTRTQPVLGRIVFLPVPNDYQTATDQTPSDPIGVWTTPFGPEGELYGHLRRRFAGEADEDVGDALVMDWEGRYLHHDLTVKRPIEVTYDDSLPVPFRASLAAAVRAWNDALGRNHLRLVDKPQRVDSSDCLSGFRLCISWRGPAAIELGGASGYTELAFDPLTGLIVGGRIFVVNDSPRELKEPDAALVARLKNPQIADVADIVLSFNDYIGIRHPYPADYFKYLFTHELGHFHGLGHDFHVGSTGTSLSDPLRTIMAYPVFPVAHRASAITTIDKKRLGVVYKGDKLEGLPEYCSTTEVFAPLIGEAESRRAEGCDMFVVGEPAEWYLTLARRGRFGVFTQYPDNSQWSDEMRAYYQEMLERGDAAPLNVLTHLGGLLAEKNKGGEDGRAKIRKYLCGLESERMAVAAQLKDFHAVTLACD